jgi:HD superfamily phosphohydrolase
LRDSFFTGVSEGVIGTDRIIKMLTVVDDKLVVEQKGIYSIEKFLIARRLMYWQVYLHKTVLSAENMLVKILQRTKELTRQYHYELFVTPALQFFLKNNITKKDFANNKNVIQNFVQLDDNDIMASIKVWANSNDFILSTLCQKFIQRNLFRTILQNEEFSKSTIKNIQSRMKKIYPQLSKDEFEYFVISGNVNNNAYIKSKFKIEIYDGKTLRDIAKASDNENIEALRKTVTKYYLCYDKIVDE